MHRAWRCVVAQKSLLVFKTTQGCFWEEYICSQGVQLWWIPKPQKSRGRLQGSFGVVWKKCPKNVKIRWCFRVAESGMKVASTQKRWLMAVLRDGKDPVNFVTCIAHHGALALQDTSVII